MSGHSPIELAAIAWAVARREHWAFTRPIYKRTGQPSKEETAAIDASLARIDRLRDALEALAISAAPPTAFPFDRGLPFEDTVAGADTAGE